MSSGDHDCLGSGLCFLAFLRVTGRAGFRIQFDVERSGAFFHEDSRSDKDSLRSKLHHEGRVGWSSYATSREIWNRQLPGLGHHPDQLIGSPMFLGGRVQFLVAQHSERSHFAHDLPHMLDRVPHIPCAGFALGANHRGAFRDAP